jgi:DNA polymerase delta subunit 1
MDDVYKGIEGVDYKTYEIADGVFETFAIRPGEKSVLCAIEETLGDARKATKKLMKSAKDPFKYSLLDAAQKAQKVTCNSLYGFTGTTSGMLPKKEIAAAVTCTGREIIMTTKRYLEDTHKCFCVYGDTDSVMVNFPIPSSIDKKSEQEVLKYLFKMGEQAAAEITGLFGYPVELEFENIYWPYLLISKKRYAGRSITSVNDPGKVSVKGLVSERRDNAPVVGKTARRCIEMLMGGESPKAVTDFVVETLHRIQNGTVDMSDLTICKELKQWFYAGLQPHAELAKTTAQRNKEQRFFHSVSLPYVEGHVEIDWASYGTALGEIMRLVDGAQTPSKLFEALKTPEYNKEAEAKRLLRVFGNSRIFTELIENDICTAGDVQNQHDAFRPLDVLEWTLPKLGDRIGFVVTEGAGDISSRVEDPRAIQLLKLKPDISYYLVQMETPLSDLLQHVDKNIKEKFVPFKREALNKKAGNRSITSFFHRAPESEPAAKRPKTIKL